MPLLGEGRTRGHRAYPGAERPLNTVSVYIPCCLLRRGGEAAGEERGHAAAVAASWVGGRGTSAKHGAARRAAARYASGPPAEG